MSEDAFRRNRENPHLVSCRVGQVDLRTYVRSRLLEGSKGIQVEVLERVDVKNTRDHRQNILSKGLVER